MKLVGWATVALGALCSIAFAVVLISKVRSGDAFAYGAMAALAAGSIALAYAGIRTLRPA